MSTRMYRDGQTVRVKNMSVNGVVVGYRKGHEFPYKVQTPKGIVYRSVNGLSGTVAKGYESKTKSQEGDNDMGNIRQKIRELTKSREDRLFEKHGLTEGCGVLTDLGRRVVLDKLFADADLRAAVLADVEAVEADEDKKTAKKK